MADTINRLLARWQAALQKSGATPLLMAGFTRDGKLMICMPEDMPVDAVEEILSETLDLVRKGKATRK